MHISLTPIEHIKPYARNPRVNDLSVAKVAASIKEFGWQQPIVVDKNMVVVVGHTRLLAAKRLGYKSVPVHIADNLTDAQIKAYRIADNRTHEDSKWDMELLGIELGDLKESDIDLAVTGFDADELDKLIKIENVNFADENDVPEITTSAISQLGDMWLLGDHKLLCGDAVYIDSYKQLLGNKLADMVFTDPPYNVEYTRGARERIDAHYSGKVTGKILNDNLGASFEEFLKNICRHLVANTNGAIYLCMAAGELDTLQDAFREAGGYWSTFIVWAKNHFSLNNSDYQKQYETILYGWPKGSKHFWCGARDQTDLWFFDKPDSSRLHPTMKPVELVSKAITNSSKSGDIVLDSFGGSGSTLIACEKTNRRCRMMELDPQYCDTIIQRWQIFTGKQATLESSGKTFSETKTSSYKANRSVINLGGKPS